MKAKEYVEQLIDENGETSLEKVTDVVHALLAETFAILKTRNSRKVDSLNAPFVEQEMKWFAICNRANKKLVHGEINKAWFKEYSRGWLQKNKDFTLYLVLPFFKKKGEKAC